MLSVLVLGASACGGGGGGRYEETGLDITFKIPSGFSIAHDLTISKSAGANAADQAAVGLDGDNLIIVQRFDLSTSVTTQNLPGSRARSTT